MQDSDFPYGFGKDSNKSQSIEGKGFIGADDESLAIW